MKVNFLFCVMIKVLKYPLLPVYSYIQREVYKGLSLRAMHNPLTPEWLVLCTLSTLSHTVVPNHQCLAIY